MTTQESPRISRMQVLTDEHGSILAAVLRTTDVASGPASGEDVPPQVSLVPSEGQALHELSVTGDEMFESLDQWVVRVDAGEPALVRRAGA
ncbi:hypothetical protein [Rhodococcus opacus]|uniref:Uncharacterized protein n=1 Tax=Rhodococcus opacus TaxID=37919 RepID=A0A076ENC4_RHOOP|nr:hypothetical protein [Rhodococcus opacus]AII07301.1 hypothetical protein EP51_22655 [Rhodococcus opacus]